MLSTKNDSKKTISRFKWKDFDTSTIFCAFPQLGSNSCGLIFIIRLSEKIINNLFFANFIKTSLC